MKIIVTGTRGIPNIQGGVETHCEELYPRLAALGYDITVIRRSCYVSSNNNFVEYKGVKLQDIYAPRKKSIEAILHTFLAICYARLKKADILHVHAIGPAIMIPFARLLGLKVVMTHHGPDYDRQKWGRLAKMTLKYGEKMAARYSNEIIVISNVINDILRKNYNRNYTHLIYNGVNTPLKATGEEYIGSLGLVSHKYILTVGRFVEEKGFDLLIKVYSALNLNDRGYRLVIAGDADHRDDYSENLKKLAKKNNIILTGFIRGEKLNEIYSHAALFVLPSYHEGLPIALLEALSYNLDVLVSDIPANRLSCLSSADFFETGSPVALQSMLMQKLENIQLERTYDLSPYNWDHIARQIAAVYEDLKS